MHGNKQSLKTFRKTVTTPGTAEQLPNVEVPDGMLLVVKALDANTGDIEVGETQAIAQGASAFILRPGEALEFAVINANLIWIDTTVAGGGVSGIVEKQ